MKTKTLFLLLAILTGFFVMTGCNSDNDQPVSDGTIVGKWRLISSGPFKIEYRQEMTFDMKGSGTFFSNKDGKTQKETFTYEFVEGDNESSYKKYLRVYSKNLSENKQYTDYHWNIEGNTMSLDLRGVLDLVGSTKVYKRVR